jgi:hypothetical protein
MKPTLTVARISLNSASKTVSLRAALATLLLAPLAAIAQEKPEVANATKAAKRAWESAPAERKALWLQQREALKHIDLRCIMTFSSIVRLKDGSSLGLFHRGSGIGEEGTLQVLQSITRDGGFTWSEPVIVCDGTKLDGKHPCEPYVFRSPADDELCCLMRENRRSGTSLVMFSRDEGQTWSKAVDAPWGLTGDRHHGIRLPDGRLVIVFRNASPNAKDKGFIAWVGTYDDIQQGKPGQYRVSLLKTFKDGFYPGLHLLPDGTLVATTYANYLKEDIGTSIVSVRFKMSEVDALAAKLTLGSRP